MIGQGEVDEIWRMREKGCTMQKIADEIGISTCTAHRYLHDEEAVQAAEKRRLVRTLRRMRPPKPESGREACTRRCAWKTGTGYCVLPSCMREGK